MKSFAQVLNVENMPGCTQVPVDSLLGLTCTFRSNQQFRQYYYYY